MVEHLSDDDLQSLPRGGHDYRKLYAAYRLAVEHKGSPTVILAKTVKGWALGTGLEARNATHQIKELDPEQLKTFRDRLQLPISDADIEDGDPPYYHPGTDSPEYEYLMARRQALAGPMPTRVVRAKPVPMPPPDTFADFLAGTGEKVQASTTTAFARMLRNLLRDPGLGTRVVPIIPDEARTFGLDALFRELKIYAPFGQAYEPVDAALLLSYTEARDGRILEEGITEAGSMASTTAAGTAYATWGQPMIPFFIFYSMFGFQRVGDLIWSFGDQRGRGFLLGATAGRTTLTGEGLQHCDGQSQVLSTTVPNCRAYDPAFAYEVAVIIREGIERMYGENAEDVFYYLTLYNENYSMPRDATGRRGRDRARASTGTPRRPSRRRTARSCWRAAPRCSRRSRRSSCSPTSSTSPPTCGARRATSCCARTRSRSSAGTVCIPRSRHACRTSPTRSRDASGPVIAVTDFMKVVPDQISRFVPQPFVPLGTDGYGFSDTRPALRRHFEVDAPHIVVATLDALAARRLGEAGSRRQGDPALRHRSRPSRSQDGLIVRTPDGRLRRCGAGRPRPSRRGRRLPRHASSACRRPRRRQRATFRPR